MSPDLTPGPLGGEGEDLGMIAVDPEWHLLEVEDDVGRVLDHSWNGGELVKDPFDLDRRDARPLDGGQEDPPHGVPDGGPETPLERLRGESAERRRQRLPLDLEPLRLLKPLPEHPRPPAGR
jgi:hypothetical protein